MKSRNYLARLKAKAKATDKVKETVNTEPEKVEVPVEIPIAEPVEEKPEEVKAEPVKGPALGTILSIDPETAEVVESFESIEKAVEAGYNKPNLVSAIKRKTKYKGHLWSKVK